MLLINDVRYEYWWGRQKGWKSELLTTFTAETAVMWMSGQGQVVWNKYLNCYVFVRLGKLQAHHQTEFTTPICLPCRHRPEQAP